MIRTSQSILYSDRDDSKMVRVRKLRVFTSPVWAAIVGGLLTLEFYLLVEMGSRLSPGLRADGATLFAVWLLGTCALLALFVSKGVGDIREGVELSEASLRLFGRAILIPSIRRAAIVSFPSSTGGFGPVLAIDCVTGGGERGAIQTRFLHPTATKDVLSLTNAIRSLKGWSPQREPFSCRWKDWKTSRGEAGVPPKS